MYVTEKIFRNFLETIVNDIEKYAVCTKSLIDHQVLCR